MLTVTGLWFDHERTPVGLDHTPVFGWQLEGNCRNIRQTQYRLQVALTPDFAALLYDETCETGNSTAVHAAGLTLQSLQKYYARVQVCDPFFRFGHNAVVGRRIAVGNALVGRPSLEIVALADIDVAQQDKGLG